MSTMVLPFISGRWPTCDRRGDRRARRDADRDALDAGAQPRHGQRLLVGDGDHLVIDLGVEDRRARSRRRCPGSCAGPDLPPDSTGLSAGSTAITLRPGLRCFSTWPTPVMVPPVPTPATKASTSPSVSFQISSAVVRRWISGLAGFSNCCGITASGISLDQLLGALHGAAHALGALGQHQFGAEQPQHLAPLHRHRLRHDEDQAIAARRRDEGERDAGIARGRLDQRGDAGVDAAGFLQRVDHGDADAVLDAGDRVEEFELGDEMRRHVLHRRDAVEPDQRRVADRVGDRIVDLAAPAAALRSCRHG